MITAKAIMLTVRPIQSSDLCYPMSGIIESQPEELLGINVDGYDLPSYRQELEPRPTLPSVAELLGWSPSTVAASSALQQSGILSTLEVEGPDCDGPDRIESDLANYTLSRLRADDIATQLTQAIAWYGLKHGADQADEAIEKRIELLGRNTSDPSSLLTLLDKLSTILRTRYETLRDEYNADGVGVVVDQKSEAISNATTTGQPETLVTDTTMTTTYSGREYEVPLYDNRARWLRSEVSLRQERLAAFRLVKLNSHENILREKAMTTAEIRKIQLAYVDTFLIAPFDGIVTAVFRNVGDFVTAGQPVLRVENDKTVYLIGIIKCRDFVKVGDNATVSTTLFGEPGALPVDVSGTICAVRGHEPVDEQWNVVIRCDNTTASGGRILPLNYDFDFDGTSIEIDPA